MMNEKRGAILITVIVILAFLSTLGLSLVTFLISRLAQSSLELERLKAYYLAEAGIAQSVYELRWARDVDNNGLGNVLKTPLAGGSFRAFHSLQTATITGVGEFNNVIRKVQIKYSAL
jgi:type II secretory pathway component PulK